MNKKILFIIHDLYQNDVEFPLGVGYLSAVLQKQGYKIDIANQDLYHWSNEETVDKWVKNNSYDIIGMGFLSARFVETVLPLCKEINKHKGNALLVLGGHGATATPEYILKATQADIIVMGEGEETIIDLMEHLDNYESLKGIAYRKGNQITVNERRPPIKDLDSIPFPAWNLFPMEKYRSTCQYMGQDKNEYSFPMLTSKGCTNKCRFCFRTEKGIRFRSIQNVMEEMKQLYDKYNITYFIFQDELFIANIKRLKEFIQGLKDWGMYGKIKYNMGGIRANIVTDELAQLLKESGCEYANVGFESMDQQGLDEMDKRETVEDNIRCAEILRKYKVTMGLNFIWGVPSDNEETLKRRVEFLRKYNSYSECRTIRFVTPYPACQMYLDAIDKGLLKDAEDFYNRFKNSDLLTVNFTKIPTEEAYRMMFKANTELILDHLKHSVMSVDEARDILKGFFGLYFEGMEKFRGARVYLRKEEK
jgi:radical SAM superfamily enzyme YgiQ (UPF0313 family)